jgi:ligand-binding sensor domain-containing protein
MPFPRGLREVGTVLLGLLLCSAAAQGGERRYYFDSLGSERGLTSHTVTALLQDHTGYVWIATQDGVHQYDGYRYRQFHHVPDDTGSLPESFVTALAEDGEGRIWIGGATHGLAALDPASGKVAARSEIGAGKPEPRDAIGALLFDPAHGLWIGTAAGVELMDLSSRQRRELFHFPAGSDTARVLQLTRASDGSVWAATSTGVLRFAAADGKMQALATRELPAAFSVFAAADGAVFAGGSDGLYRIDAQHDSGKPTAVAQANDETFAGAQTGGRPPRIRCMTSETTKATRKTKNRICAMLAPPR